MSVHRIMQWDGMGQMQDAGWVGGDTCRIRARAVSGFWWGSAPQVLLVQQPEWLIHGCKAMEAEAWTHPTGREHDMPRQSFE